MNVKSFRLFIAISMLSCLPAAAQADKPTLTANRVVSPVDEIHVVPLSGNVLPIVQARFDRGPAPISTATGRITLMLQRSATQQQALTQYLGDLQHPGSASFHRWLTPEQYGAMFGLTESDLQAVESWLESHGFKIEKVPQARNVIEFSGSIDQLQSAFHTSIHSFSIKGDTYFANVGDPQIPAALAAVVAGVGPLTNFHPKPTLLEGPRGHYDPTSHTIQPDLTLSGNGNNYLFVDPADAATIYNLPNANLNSGYTGTTYDGAGITIGIVGVSDLTTADVANYRIAFLGETSSSVNLPTSIVDGDDPGLNSAGVEALLDNEIVGAIAPKAKVYFYTSADVGLSSGLMNAIFRALDDNSVSILNISFGECEAAIGTSGNQAILEAAEQAAAQGISVTVSAGDAGSAGCDDFNTQATAQKGLAVNAFASTPFTIAVGGTDFDVLSQSFSTYVNATSSGNSPYYRTALKYIPENPWNDSSTVNTTYSNNIAYKDANGTGNIVSGGGGVSAVYSKPSFQRAITPNDGFRDLPDVSLFAADGLHNAIWAICSDNVTDGNISQVYTECRTSSGQFTSSTVFGGVGGTSAAAPAFAGMLALVAQANASSSDNFRLGQANYILYQLAQLKYSTVFHDITTGNNSVPCASGTANCGSNGFLAGYNAATGYDLASGLGSVDASAMVKNWSSVGLGSTSTSLTINSSTAAYTGAHGASLTFGVGVTPTSATGVIGILDNSSAASVSGPQNSGQFAIPITGGRGSATYNGLPGGSYTVWARYGGDASNGPSISSPPINVTITPESSTTSLSVSAYDAQTGNPIPATNIPYGSWVFANAQITGTAEGPKTQGVATGTVTFSDGATTLGSSNVGSQNEASWPPLSGTFPAFAGGSHSITATYVGDVSFNSSKSSSQSFTIVPASTSINAQVNGSVLTPGGSSPVVVTISTQWNAGAVPTGTVTLSANNTTLSTATIFNPHGSTKLPAVPIEMTADLWIQASQLAPGLNTVTVTYSGDTNYAGSSTAFAVDNVASGGGFSMSSGTVSLAPGTAVTTAITLTSSGGYTGYVVLGGPITPATDKLTYLSLGTRVPITGSADALVAISAPPRTSPGNYTIALEGEDTNAATISATSTLNVIVSNTPVPSFAMYNGGNITIGPGANSGNTSLVTIIPSGGFTGQVNLSCAVTTTIPNPASAPTCTVPTSITINGTTAIPASVSINSTIDSSPGIYTVAITATDAATASISASKALALTVTTSPSFALTSSNTSIALVPGANSGNTLTIVVTPFNGFTGKVNLSCSDAGGVISSTLVSCQSLASVMVSGTSPVTATLTLSGMNTNPPGMAGPGVHYITVSGFAPALPAVSAQTSVDVIVSAEAPGFSLSSSGNIQLSRGATTGNTATVSVTPSAGFIGIVKLACAVTASPTNAVDPVTCSIPSTVNVAGTTAASATLTVATTAHTSATLSQPSEKYLFGGGGAVLALLFFIGIPARRRFWRTLLGLMTVMSIISISGCGSSGSNGSNGGGNPGTTPGAYTITVTGTDAATGQISAKTSVTVTVN